MKNATPQIEIIKSRVQERIDALGISRNEASRRAGIGLSYVNDLLAGRSKKPTKESLTKLASVLECDVAYLLGQQDNPRSDSPPAPVVAAPQHLRADEAPLYQVGLPAADGSFELGAATGTLALTFAAEGAYGIVVPDDTLAPRYGAGEVVIVNPRKPVSRGGYAVVRMVDGRAMIRAIASIAPDRITVATLDGSAPVDIPRDRILRLDRVVASVEM